VTTWADVVSDIERAPGDPSVLAATPLGAIAEASYTPSSVAAGIDTLRDVLDVQTLGELLAAQTVEPVLRDCFDRHTRTEFLRGLPDVVRKWALEDLARSERAATRSARVATLDGAASAFDPEVVPLGGPELDVWARHFGVELRGIAVRVRVDARRVLTLRLEEMVDVVRFPDLGRAERLPRDRVRNSAVEHLRAEARKTAPLADARTAFLSRRDDPAEPWLASRIAGLEEALQTELAGAPEPEADLAFRYPKPVVQFVAKPPLLEIFTQREPLPHVVDLERFFVRRAGRPLGSSHLVAGAPWAASSTILRCAIDALRDPRGGARLAVEAFVSIPPWRRALADLEGRVGAMTAHEEGPSSERVAFRLPLAGGLVPRVLLQTPKRNGHYTAGRLVSPADALHRGALDALDRDILEIVDALGSYPAPNKRSTLIRLFDLLAKHPRLYVDGDAQTPWRLVRARARLVVVPDEGGHRLELHLGELRVDEREVLGRSPLLACAIVAPGTAVYAPLDDVARAIIETMAMPREVFPIEAIDAVFRIVRQQKACALDVELPPALRGTEISPDTTPIVRLSLRAGGALEVALRVRPWPTGSLEVPGEGAAEIVGLRDGGGRAFVVRERELEAQRAAAVIEALGTAYQPSAPFDGYIHDPDESCEAVLRLAEMGDAVVTEWEGTPLRVTATATTSSVRISIDKRRDWFGVDGSVDVDGEQVGLADLLEAIRKGRRFVRLRRGGLLAIGKELRQRLARADDLIVSDGQKLAVGTHAALLLGDLVDDESQIEAAKEWLELKERFRAAETFEPVVPDALRATLRPYQVAGFGWLARLAACGVAGCLADDMGLGKTLQALAILVDRASSGPALVIAPTSVGPNWEAETARFAPTLRVVPYRGSRRRGALESLRPGDLVVASYDLLVREADALAKVGFATIVLDEAHALKNPQSKRAQAARKLEGGFRLALTGTPVENHLGELWSLFRVLMPAVFGSWDRFRARFAVPIERDHDPERRAALAALVRPYLLRRTKGEVAPELPSRTEVVRHVDLSPEERLLYETERKASLASLETRVPDGDARFAVFSALMRLRQLACHPRLRHPDSLVPSSKLASAVELLDELREAGHRALVFSQFTSHLALVRAALRERGFVLHELDGSTPADARADRVKRFQAGEGDVFLISLKAGGVGLNLTGADYVVHLDPWWNPAAEDQASDRAHRIGQDKPVTVVRLIARGTIEETVLELHADKRELAAAVLGEGDASAKLSTSELVALMAAGGRGEVEKKPPPFIWGQGLP
jgi:superfamily II DNA or RNA helicase